jgi:hypothetical protein
MEKSKLRFDGQIMWCKGKNTLQWSELKPDATKRSPFTHPSLVLIYWGESLILLVGADGPGVGGTAEAARNNAA